jgi:NAD dependent epimerase/dehydratase family enzyme
MSPGRGGIFDTLLRLVRAGLGGAAGSGEQFVSWIHYLDFIRTIEFLIARTELEGPVNVCAPHPLPNCDFMRALRDACGKRFGLPFEMNAGTGRCADAHRDGAHPKKHATGPWPVDSVTAQS